MLCVLLQDSNSVRFIKIAGKRFRACNAGRAPFPKFFERIDRYLTLCVLLQDSNSVRFAKIAGKRFCAHNVGRGSFAPLLNERP